MPGPLNLGAGLALGQGRGISGTELLSGQRQALFVGLQGLSCQRQLFLVCPPGQIGRGNVADQAQPGAALGLFLGKILLNLFLAQAAVAAEQIQFVCADSQPDRVIAPVLRTPKGARSGGTLWRVPEACTETLGNSALRWMRYCA